MRTLVVIFLFVFCAGHAQDVLVEGHVLDEKSKTPVPYANVSFLKTLKGTSSDEDGYFYMYVA